MKIWFLSNQQLVVQKNTTPSSSLYSRCYTQSVFMIASRIYNGITMYMCGWAAPMVIILRKNGVTRWT
jgi:hypothetical protein